MSVRKRTAALASVIALLAAPAANAGPKDESAAEWLPIPQAFKDLRERLDAAGVAFGVTYVGDNITNVSGGMKRGAIHFGRVDTSTDLDLEKLVGWSGAKVHANVFNLYGRGLSRNYVGNIATISEIEALPDTRLYEAYIEQAFLDNRFTIKAGQQSADQEFFDSRTDDLFMNGTFGWPAVMANNLPAGGPAPPIAVPGVRIKASLSDRVTAYAAIFNGDAAGPGDGDPQLRDHHGLAFRLRDPPWMIGQIRFDYTLELGGNALPGNITPGAWLHTGRFDHQRLTAEGDLLADPASSGIPARLRSNRGVYVVIEQTLVKPSQNIERNTFANDKGITVFARFAYSPPDRNLIDFYADGGIGFNNMIESRPNDRFGFAAAYMHISRSVRQFDLDGQVFSGLPTPVRSSEVLFEAIYEAHIKQGWLLQPFFQYIVRPGGGIANPNDPSGLTRIGNVAVFGLTTTLKY